MKRVAKEENEIEHEDCYINKIQQDATVCRYLFSAKSLHISGVHRTHHQEYI
jgi:hypothetical protein